MWTFFFMSVRQSAKLYMLTYLLVFYTYSNKLLQFSKRKFPNKPAIISQHLPGACLKKAFCNLPHHIFLTRLKLNTQ